MPHGGGPCFFMEGLGPPGTWTGMAAWLKVFGVAITPMPRALVVVSAHWEEKKVTVNRGQTPALLYDYYGFPEHTYKIQYPAPGSPEVAAEVMDCLGLADIEAEYEDRRGFDHGVFIPLKVAFPDANIPIVQVSLKAGLEPSAHLRIGRALANLREKNILIVGSGMSYHNLSKFQSGGGSDAKAFDDWLTDTTTKASPQEREKLLANWSTAPGARKCHPREEHLLPLMVCAGAAGGDSGYRVYNELIFGSPVSAFIFGSRVMPVV
jgi:aromatic ring-opening dioxygenase catalytic subunit (LigB family)